MFWAAFSTNQSYSFSLRKDLANLSCGADDDSNDDDDNDEDDDEEDDEGDDDVADDDDADHGGE